MKEKQNPSKTNKIYKVVLYFVIPTSTTRRKKPCYFINTSYNWNSDGVPKCNIVN